MTTKLNLRPALLLLLPLFALISGCKDMELDIKESLDSLEDVIDLSPLTGGEYQTANCYIISQVGTYGFKAFKGNSQELAGTANEGHPEGAISEAVVLWETFGAEATPMVGDLIKSVSYKDGDIYFQTADTFKEGNAVIAAKDADGNILWSWHIWLTDQPQGQVYYNDAGTMMDRNLGATSATPGDVGALGLLYQWGRKDPFLGSSSISEAVEAKSTITWPSVVESDSNTGTIDYATSNPTTFITKNSSNDDWYYTGSDETDNTRWTTSSGNKSIYDPCPAGWRVPDGGENGVWSKALGSSSTFTQSSLYDSTNEGMNLSGRFGSASTIWHPASGCRYCSDGGLGDVGNNGLYWSASPNSNAALHLRFYASGHLSPIYAYLRADGQSVRCLQESSIQSTPDLTCEDLSSDGTANSYIVSSAGAYKFTPTKGSSDESVGAVSSAEVLWESFGTDATPDVGDLLKNVKYKDGAVYFETPSTFKEGNAVIAAKDAEGNILWSWHIWLTDQPQGQVYYNDAGTMMDRNLGATSATPGDVGALGLLYQWGRKDPFLSSSSISEAVEAKSTITWPSAVESDSNTGTIEYATANPTTFITDNSSKGDWYYTGDSSTDDTRWTTSSSNKSIYDPCPAGWRVPDGGSNGVWSKALGSSATFTQSSLYDSANEGMNLSGRFGVASPIWHPASGCRRLKDGSLSDVGDDGLYWSASPNYTAALHLRFYADGHFSPIYAYLRADGQSVRCLQDGNGGGVEEAVAVDLSAEASANSYIVSSEGTYMFNTVKGNSSTSVGDVESAEVLWESFGTSTTPSVGDLVRNVSYKDAYITFQTADTFKEGNAVIAAKDAEGNILWSWHIWLTDQPRGQVYYNDAGTMMDRNLGATSTAPGDVSALGLLYQWGRKDPFLGSSSIREAVEAKSTITWPSAVESDSNTGTISYAIANPTTFISCDENNIAIEETDHPRWTDPSLDKSIYDPCPAGWRVPYGDSLSVWSVASGFSYDSYISYSDYFPDYSFGNDEWRMGGLNMSAIFGCDAVILYPQGYFRGSNGQFSSGRRGWYWSASYNYLLFTNTYIYNGTDKTGLSSAYVRCILDSSVPSIAILPIQSHSYDSGTYNVKYKILRPSFGQKLSMTTDVDWITDLVDNDGAISYKLSPNNSGKERKGKITMKYAGRENAFTVSQDYLDPGIELNPSSATLTFDAGKSNFSYRIRNPRADSKVSLSTDVKWITNLVEEHGVVSYTISSNNSGASRSGNIKLSYCGKTASLLVTQRYLAPSLTLQQSDQNLTYKSGTQKFSYTIENPRSDQFLSLSTDVSWITDLVDDAGGTVSYEVSANGSMAPRTGKIILSYAGLSTTVVVTQCGKWENLSLMGTANCYIAQKLSSDYGFLPTKGNSNATVGSIASVCVLWESFCGSTTSRTPQVGDVIQSVSCENGYIVFKTGLHRGNAVIAAKDTSGKILWSWHIWCIDGTPGEIVYNNNAGIMMDRNLGAISSDGGFGSPKYNGLMYQWGRKDPFLGAEVVNFPTRAKSTISWPGMIRSSSTVGTIDYSIAHPTRYISSNEYNSDWFYTGNKTTDNTRWTASGEEKSIYDPCPVGWRVPDGGDDGVWARSLGASSLGTSMQYNEKSYGLKLNCCWPSDYYPAAGFLDTDGDLSGVADVGQTGRYWTSTPKDNYAYIFYFTEGDVSESVSPANHSRARATGAPVRCMKDSSIPPVSNPVYKNLSSSGTANSYVVSEGGLYSFSAVKGNSSESVGVVNSVEVIWESYGTEEVPKLGGLIKSVSFSKNQVRFQTADTFKEGNAVIAAKDASGTILWSWHIWLTDKPAEQKYFNNAGIMMDRNLGATSATPGDKCTEGLLYQWGRKDPFLGGYATSQYSWEWAKSTITWPSAVESNSNTGTIEYATSHPTTFITGNDWYYTGSDFMLETTRWTESSKVKSIYDPCPTGWRVPDGDSNNIWVKALESTSSNKEPVYKSFQGVNCAGVFGAYANIWYPITGYIDADGQYYRSSGVSCFSASADYIGANTMFILSYDTEVSVEPIPSARGFSVRCAKE